MQARKQFPTLGYFVEYCSGGSNYRLRDIEDNTKWFYGKVLKGDSETIKIAIKEPSYRHLEQVVECKQIGDKVYVVCEPSYDLQSMKTDHKIIDCEELVWKVTIETLRALSHLEDCCQPHRGKLTISFNSQAEALLISWYVCDETFPLTSISDLCVAIDKLFPLNCVTNIFSDISIGSTARDILRLPQIATRIAFSSSFHKHDVRAKILDKREATLKKKQAIFQRISKCLKEFDFTSTADGSSPNIQNRELSFGQSLTSLLTSLNSGGSISIYGDNSSMISVESDVHIDPFAIDMIRNY